MYENNLRKCRESLGMSQTELSRKSGLTSSMISSVETYRVRPFKKFMKAVCDTLGMSLEEIFPSEYVEIKQQLNDLMELVGDK